MPTRGRFVCHVHCLAHDGAVRSSPCGPHHENFGRNLYHMFVPAYSASQSFVFVLFCGIRVASMPSVDSIPYPKRCSHISMWMIILLDYRDCHANSFQPTCSFQVDTIISTFARSILSSLNDVCFIHPKLPLFFPPSHPFLQGLVYL